MVFPKDYFYFILGAIVLVGLITLAVLLEERSKEEQLRACEDIGGEYIVIDREWSAVTKTTVDVYGCVK